MVQKRSLLSQDHCSLYKTSVRDWPFPIRARPLRPSRAYTNTIGFVNLRVGKKLKRIII